jgi:hypothetical protein
MAVEAVDRFILFQLALMEHLVAVDLAMETRFTIGAELVFLAKDLMVEVATAASLAIRPVVVVAIPELVLMAVRITAAMAVMESRSISSVDFNISLAAAEDQVIHMAA